MTFWDISTERSVIGTRSFARGARLLMLGMCLLMAASPGLSDVRGSDSRIDRSLTAYYRHSQDTRIVTELGANYAVRYAETGKDQDKGLALKYLQEAVKLDSRAAAPKAWLGLVQCIDAREGCSKEKAKEGLVQMDKALKRDPKNLDLRLLRASVSVEAPRDFDRLDQSIADLEFIRARVQADRSQAQIYEIEMPEVYLNLGLAYRGKGELTKARTAWELAVKDGPATSYGQRAAKLLKKHPAPSR